MEVESVFQEQDEGSAGKNEPDLLNMLDKADISSTLPGKNGHPNTSHIRMRELLKGKRI